MLRTPLDPEVSFSDDPLRMLRLFRFMSTLGFTADPTATEAVQRMRGRLEIVSAERIRNEFDKLMMGSHVERALVALVESGLADEFIPELPALAVEQDPIHRHKDVLAHTIAVVGKTDPILRLRLAALFHDIGKPATREFTGGGVTFHHHEVVGARMTRRRMEALRYPKQMIEDVSELVFLHMRPHTYKMGWSDSAVRRYVRDAGPLLDDLNRLVRSDVTTRNKRRARAIANRIDELEERIDELRSARGTRPAAASDRWERGDAIPRPGAVENRRRDHGHAPRAAHRGRPVLRAGGLRNARRMESVERVAVHVHGLTVHGRSLTGSGAAFGGSSPVPLERGTIPVTTDNSQLTTHNSPRDPCAYTSAYAYTPRMPTAAILGASGYAGGELIRFLDAHPSIELIHLGAHSKAGRRLGEVHPHLEGGDRLLGTIDPDDVPDVDVVFLALPHGASAEPAMSLAATNARVVDLGSDFRLDSPDRYRDAYGTDHPYPHQLGAWAYGIPELFGDDVRAARYVAAPGCYPTSAVLGLGPLAADGLIEPVGIIVDSLSGVSGAGRGVSEGLQFGAVGESVRAYKVLQHRHRPEMERALDALGASAHRITFTPHLVPMQRGILSTIYAQTVDGVVLDELTTSIDKRYGDARFVRRPTDAPPETRWVTGSNNALMSVHLDDRSGRVVIVSAIDNLVKGAAGQAVQCANLMLGLDEAAGLPTDGVDAVSVVAATGDSGRPVSPRASRRTRARRRGDRWPTTRPRRPPVFTRNLAAAPPVLVSR